MDSISVDWFNSKIRNHLLLLFIPGFYSHDHLKQYLFLSIIFIVISNCFGLMLVWQFRWYCHFRFTLTRRARRLFNVPQVTPWSWAYDREFQYNLLLHCLGVRAAFFHVQNGRWQRKECSNDFRLYCDNSMYQETEICWLNGRAKDRKIKNRVHSRFPASAYICSAILTLMYRPRQAHHDNIFLGRIDYIFMHILGHFWRFSVSFARFTSFSP